MRFSWRILLLSNDAGIHIGSKEVQQAIDDLFQRSRDRHRFPSSRVRTETKAVLHPAKRRRTRHDHLPPLAVLRFDDEMTRSGLHMNVRVVAALPDHVLKARR